MRFVWRRDPIDRVSRGGERAVSLVPPLPAWDAINRVPTDFLRSANGKIMKP